VKTLRLGTRRSLLAWAQSSWVAREIERLSAQGTGAAAQPTLKVELVGIDTRGDRIQDVPLQAVAGKEFFVAELDEALASGRVDLNVHSLKDLSLDRPEAFVCAAIPKRENPRDVVLFGPSTLERLRSGQPVRIGTSSPRRLENIPGFLRQALPRFEGAAAPEVQFVEIRGNVNTRLSRVHEPESSAKKLDAVVLAFAGLIRLWKDDAGRPELARLFQGVRWMVLPLRECAAAPGQGALAVECRADDAFAREAIGRLHDAITARQVAHERGLLAAWGGGCHQKFGATTVTTPLLGDVQYVRGRKPDGVYVEETRWNPPAPPAVGVRRAWDGSTLKGEARELSGVRAPQTPATFVAHWRAVPSRAVAGAVEQARVWVSGTSSWFKLAQLGIWVEGCAEGLGFEFVRPTLEEPVLGLPALAQWSVLTHAGAEESWSAIPSERVCATYEVMPPGAQSRPEHPAELAHDLKSATDCFWSSVSQFDTFGSLARPEARHACGPGKTAAHLKKILAARGREPLVFPSVEEWKKWLDIR
jgi:hydroxymethylbilane synthase